LPENPNLTTLDWDFLVKVCVWSLIEYVLVPHPGYQDQDRLVHLLIFSLNTMKTLLLVALGGGIGSTFRYLIGLYLYKYFPTAFPWGTFLVNVTGCLLMGLLMGVLDRGLWTDPGLKLFLIVGLCGGFTTFSAFSMESITLIENHQVLLALVYLAASVVTGLSATVLGLFLMR
jgi:CrcB protein